MRTEPNSELSFFRLYLIKRISMISENKSMIEKISMFIIWLSLFVMTICTVVLIVMMVLLGLENRKTSVDINNNPGVIYHEDRIIH